jgi:biotin transport system substrate-specific component
MVVGEVIVFTAGVGWLAHFFGIPVEAALVDGLYPFVVGDVLKLLIAAGLLPAAWKLVGGTSGGLPSFRR